MTLSERDTERVRDVANRLAELRLGGPSALEWFGSELARLVSAPVGMCYGVEAAGAGYELKFAYGSGFTVPIARVRGLLDDHFRTVGAWGTFDPSRVSRAQQNRVIALPNFGRLPEPPHPFWNRLLSRRAEQRVAYERIERLERGAFRKIGVDDQHALRGLVCDRGVMVAWVGCYRPDEPFSRREVALFSRLFPHLRRRVMLEENLRLQPLAFGTMDAALELLFRPAYLIDEKGRVLHANRVGASLLDADRPGLRQRLEAAVKGERGARLTLTRVRAEGLPPHYLAVAPVESRSIEERARAAAAAWNLTPRQTEVLVRAASGESNKAIAAAVGRADNTVELHMTKILQRAGCRSRGELLARLMRDQHG